MTTTDYASLANLIEAATASAEAQEAIDRLRDAVDALTVLAHRAFSLTHQAEAQARASLVAAGFTDEQVAGTDLGEVFSHLGGTLELNAALHDLADRLDPDAIDLAAMGGGRADIEAGAS